MGGGGDGGGGGGAGGGAGSGGGGGASGRSRWTVCERCDSVSSHLTWRHSRGSGGGGGGGEEGGFGTGRHQGGGCGEGDGRVGGSGGGGGDAGVVGGGGCTCVPQSLTSKIETPNSVARLGMYTRTTLAAGCCGSSVFCQTPDSTGGVTGALSAFTKPSASGPLAGVPPG